jgi:hypothetical protein
LRLVVTLIPHKQRAYIASHPVVFWFCLGMMLVGALSLIDPSLTDQSATAQLLPDWVRKVFNVTYMIGGGASAIGIARGMLKLEAAGMALLATGLLVNFIVYVWLVHASAVSGVFILTLAIGCAQRSWHLANYDPRTGLPL